MDQLQYKYFLCELYCKVVIKFQVFRSEIEEVKCHREVVVLEVHQVKGVHGNEGDHDLQHEQDHEVQQLGRNPLPYCRYHKHMGFRTLKINEILIKNLFKFFLT